MKSLSFLISFLLMVLNIDAGQVTIIITSLPANTPAGDQIFIAGTFNNWNPGHPDYILHPNSNGKPQIVLQGTGTIQYKFTRGNWTKVEGNINGGYLPNRTYTFGTADTLMLTILSWEDLGGSGSTAAPNVVIMDQNFPIPQLNRTRRIWLYLPPDYHTSTRSYSVLYMHDGQNLFDHYTSFAGEWEVDETLNALYAQGKEVPIVVGIDNGGTNRINEYSPWHHPQYGGGEGDLYGKFIVETLKPYIDTHYRTRPQREYTGIMGSSLGGLISHYIALKYQHIFSKAGVFSPSFWFSDSSYIFAYQTGKQYPMRYYMMGGTNESSQLVSQMYRMKDTLQAGGFASSEIQLTIVPGGEHNEYLWRSQFGQAYQWMFLENASDTPEKNQSPVQLHLHGNLLYIHTNDNLTGDEILQLSLFTSHGNLIFQKTVQPQQIISLPGNLNGIYFIKISGGQIHYTGKIRVFH